MPKKVEATPEIVEPVLNGIEQEHIDAAKKLAAESDDNLHGHTILARILRLEAMIKQFLDS